VINLPVLTLYKYRVAELLGRDVSVDELEEWLPWLALDIEDKGEDYIKIEYNPNRPDFGSPPGIVRALKGLMGLETGLPNFKAHDSDVKVQVDPSVTNIRPYILCALVKGVSLREDYLEEIIEFQEDLHMGIGRNRRKMAIGLHDADKVNYPIKYTTVDGAFSFIPLEYGVELSINDILKVHPKGVKYAFIYEGVDKYPIILDANNTVLSFPPIINGIYTQLTTKTKNIFIDVTGTDLNILKQTINLLTTTLAEYGGEIYSVEVVYPDGGIIRSPSLEYKSMKVSVDSINRIIGLKLPLETIIESLMKSRLGVSKHSEKDIEVLIPPYRVDIMHPVDIIEDVLIGYGLWRLEPTLPSIPTIGEPDEFTVLKNKLALIMVGLGFQEVVNSILTNVDEQFSKMNITASNYIEVEAPKSRLYSILRKWLIPRLLTNLYRSKEEEYPQKIFEIGEVVFVIDGDVHEETHLAAAVAGNRQDYTIIKSVLDGFMEAIGVSDYKIEPAEHSSFISGRVGKIIVNGMDVGIIGELHPEVILNFQLAVPISAFELVVDKLTSSLSKPV